MPKVRVHEVAKQLKINSKILIDKLTDMGIEVKNHMSAIDEGQAKNIIEYYTTGMKPRMMTNEPKNTENTKQESEVKNTSAPAQQVQPAAQQAQPSQQQGQQGHHGQQHQQNRQPQQRNDGYRNRQQSSSTGYQGQRPDNRQSDNRQDRPPRQYQGNSGNSGQQSQRPQYDNRQDRPPRQYQGNSGQQSQRPQYDNRQNKPYSDRPQSDRPHSDRPQSDRPQGQGQGGYRGDNRQGQQRSYSDNRQQQSGTYRDNRQGGQQREGYSGGNKPPYQQRTQQGNSPQRSQGQPYGQGGNRPQGQGQGQNRSNNNRNFSDQKGPQRSGQGFGRSGDFGGKKSSFPLSIPVAKVDGEPPKKRVDPRNNQKPQTPSKKLQQNKSLKDLFPTTPKKPRKQAKAAKKALKEAELQQALAAVETVEDVSVVVLPKSMKVKDFSEKINKPASEIIKLLMKRGILANINQEVDFHALAKIAEDFEITVERATEVDILGEAFAEETDSEGDLKERPPVVVVMGHVDHGKTSLLDSIRKTAVTQTEAGGITQHIGAYTVSIDQKNITFLDTPGHEAFTAMRMRGAQVTDIAVLVVAADDGVMPQTIEAIDHAKAAGVEIIVAINKIDKPSANPDRVKQELVEYGLLVEDWGGQVICSPVSATTGEGIDHLLEMILLVAEMKELQANPNKKARGTVIEALLDKGRGPVATVLVQDGTLSIGDPIVAGQAFGRVRAMMDYKGKKVTKALPSMPVEILGLSEVPHAGDAFYVAQNEKHARQVAESLVAHGREEMVKAMPQKVSLDDLFSQIQAGNVKDLNIVVKADVQGSVEAIKNSLERLSNEEVRIRTIHGGVGAITETDVMLASASNAIIIGFNVRAETSARSVAETEKVDIRLYRIIYNAIEDINAAMKGMLDPVFREKVIGHAEIRQIFKASGVGNIAGAHVTDGKFTRNCQVRITRQGKNIYDGTLDALKRFKDDAKEVNAGFDCGLLFNKHNDIMEQDIVEAYIMEEVPR